MNEGKFLKMKNKVIKIKTAECFEDLIKSTSEINLICRIKFSSIFRIIF